MTYAIMFHLEAVEGDWGWYWCRGDGMKKKTFESYDEAFYGAKAMHGNHEFKIERVDEDGSD